jgi:hypothetical protein
LLFAVWKAFLFRHLCPTVLLCLFSFFYNMVESSDFRCSPPSAFAPQEYTHRYDLRSRYFIAISTTATEILSRMTTGPLLNLKTSSTCWADGRLASYIPES